MNYLVKLCIFSNLNIELQIMIVGQDPFVFKRGKGIVWVCDLSQSSSYLNDNQLANDIEAYIPRLYYISKLLVESYGGEFVKWTGDGFLAWFELVLDRNKVQIANEIFHAVNQLTMLSNVTQFGINSKKHFKIRHGITYEKDALLMTLSNEFGETTKDIIGQSVVLAFRLCSISADFPSIVTSKELISEAKHSFKKRAISKEEKLKYFKGQKFGIDSVYASSATKISPNKSVKSVIKEGDKLISKIEKGVESKLVVYAEVFINKMNRGPNWTKEILAEYMEFLKNGLFENYKTLLRHIKESEISHPPSP